MKIDTTVLQKSYEQLFTVARGRPRYFSHTKKELEKPTERFISKLSEKFLLESLGPFFMKSYLAYHYKYFTEVQTTGGIGFIQVFSHAGLKRFLSRDIQYDYQLIELHQHFPTHTLGFTKQPTNYYHRDVNKALFVQRKEPLANCLLMTTLYHHRDQSCTLCREQLACKKLLIKNYPNIARERGYVI
jgi:hypothetical protein